MSLGTQDDFDNVKGQQAFKDFLFSKINYHYCRAMEVEMYFQFLCWQLLPALCPAYLNINLWKSDLCSQGDSKLTSGQCTVSLPNLAKLSNLLKYRMELTWLTNTAHKSEDYEGDEVIILELHIMLTLHTVSKPIKSKQHPYYRHSFSNSPN